MRKIGYARASTSTQSLDRQIGALRAERCHEVYREKASGKATKGRPQLEKAIDALGTGDVLVVAEWDRATRSMMDGVHIIERIHARGAMIKVLDKPHLDLTTPIGRGFIAFLSALAEDERQRIVKRANDGRAAARKRGVHMGRKPKLTELQRRVARERIAKGESARSIAQEWGVAHTTVARAVA
jgi:DNA invertase Pin-like site-specific DNA recombinase